MCGPVIDPDEKPQVLVLAQGPPCCFSASVCLIGIFISPENLRGGLGAHLAQLLLLGRRPSPVSQRDGHPSQLFQGWELTTAQENTSIPLQDSLDSSSHLRGSTLALPSCAVYHTLHCLFMPCLTLWQKGFQVTYKGT